MKIVPRVLTCILGLGLVFAGSTFAAGPYSPTNWPPTIDPTKKVHYVVADLAPTFTVPNDNWTNSLFWVGPTGSDSTFVPQQVCSSEVTLTGNKCTGNLINIADLDWQSWNTNETIDILVQVYGDDTVMIPPSLTGARVWRFREGTTGSTLPCAGDLNSITVNGAGVSPGIHNYKWNWLLFTITNRAIMRCGTNTGNRWVGSIPDGSQGNTAYGGINGGTMRMQPQTPSVWTGLIIHAIAWGESGAFGSTNDMNLFAPADASCDPVPDQNLAGIDFNAGVTNHLQVMNDGDQTVTFTTSVGPPGDLRKAVVPAQLYLNFGILDNFLGKPCNPNVTMKVCVDFYDDPAFAGVGVLFGPESYAADQFGGTCAPNVAYPTAGLYALQGTGKWIRKSWTLPNVNLYGVNTLPLTGGPRFMCIAGQVAVSRVELAAFRTTGPLAGLDPLADCYPDPLICEGVYGNYAELDLANGVTNGLDLGTSSGDQIYFVETSGPANDQRLSVRVNAPTSFNLNFAVVTNALGPTSQGNFRLAMLVTYYDDPALIGQSFRPQVWRKEVAGSVVLAFMDPPQNMVLGGTDKWRDAYWEISAIRLDGVNQSPQAAARFECSGPIHISRVRYQVLRPCGPTAGQNPFFSAVQLNATPETNAMVRLNWFLRAPQATLQGVSAFGQPWSNFPGLPGAEGEQAVLRFAPTNSDVQFFRLQLQPQ